MRTLSQVDRLNHVHKLIEVLGDLLDFEVITGRRQRKPRQRVVGGRCHIQAFNVVTALRKQTDNA